MIIDSRFSPPTQEGLARFLNTEPHLKGYADVYGSAIYGGKNKNIHPMTAEELVALLDKARVTKVLLKSADNETTTGRKYPMDRLADYVRGREDRLIPIGGVDPHKGVAAIRELEWGVKSLGLRGVNLAPLEHLIHANDRKYYPIYSKCVELDVPVFLHTSINFSTERLLEFGHPRYIDQVAIDFPNLRIVCVHGGWPWVLEMVAVAWRHRNVYIDISGVRTRYIAMPGSGWEPLLSVRKQRNSEPDCLGFELAPIFSGGRYCRNTCVSAQRGSKTQVAWH